MTDAVIIDAVHRRAWSESLPWQTFRSEAPPNRAGRAVRVHPALLTPAGST